MPPAGAGAERFPRRSAPPRPALLGEGLFLPGLLAALPAAAAAGPQPSAGSGRREGGRGSPGGVPSLWRGGAGRGLTLAHRPCPGRARSRGAGSLRQLRAPRFFGVPPGEIGPVTPRFHAPPRTEGAVGDPSQTGEVVYRFQSPSRCSRSLQRARSAARCVLGRWVQRSSTRRGGLALLSS